MVGGGGRDAGGMFSAILKVTTFGYLVCECGADLLAATRKFVHDVRPKIAEASPEKDAPDWRKR